MTSRGVALIVGGGGLVADSFRQIGEFNNGMRQLLGPQAATLTDAGNYLKGFESGINADGQSTPTESERLEELRQEIEVLKAHIGGPRRFTGVGGLVSAVVGLLALYKSGSREEGASSNSPAQRF